MPSKVNKHLPGSQWLQNEMQNIEKQLGSSISPKKYHRLTRKLDTVVKKLNEKQPATLFAKSATKDLQDKVVSLSGALVDGYVKRQVSEIQKESVSLRERISLKEKIPPKEVRKWEKRIEEFEHDHLLWAGDRRIIADAKDALLKAKAELQDKPVINHFNWLAQQKNVRFAEENELLPGEIEELFDIAKAVYDRDLRQAKMRFHGLPEDHKYRFQNRLRELDFTAKPFDEAFPTIQALIWTVNDLVGNGETYPSSKQVDQLFLGLSEVQGEERTAEKVFSIKSKGAVGS
jgi:hypothetical protein